VPDEKEAFVVWSCANAQSGNAQSRTVPRAKLKLRMEERGFIVLTP
jgi:hypothetical protein